MNPGAVRALEDRVCLAYPKLLGDEAHERTQRVHGVTAYRCIFGSGHFHAEVLTEQALIDMAEYVREREPAAL